MLAEYQNRIRQQQAEAYLQQAQAEEN